MAKYYTLEVLVIVVARGYQLHIQIVSYLHTELYKPDGQWIQHASTKYPDQSTSRPDFTMVSRIYTPYKLHTME